MNRAERRASKEPECQHPKVMPEFDEVACRTMTSTEIRRKYPRFSGKCPDCNYEGILYASMLHYISGDY